MVSIAHICGRKKVQDRRISALIRKEITDLKTIFTSPGLLPHLSPQDLLLAVPVRTALEEMLPGLGLVRES